MRKSRGRHSAVRIDREGCDAGSTRSTQPASLSSLQELVVDSSWAGATCRLDLTAIAFARCCETRRAAGPAALHDAVCEARCGLGRPSQRHERRRDGVEPGGAKATAKVAVHSLSRASKESPRGSRKRGALYTVHKAGCHLLPKMHSGVRSILGV